MASLKASAGDTGIGSRGLHFTTGSEEDRAEGQQLCRGAGRYEGAWLRSGEEALCVLDEMDAPEESWRLCVGIHSVLRVLETEHRNQRKPQQME